MNALQIVGLVAVALGGTAVVMTADVLKQALVLGIYGIALTFLFLAFQAPDVALSEIVVTGVGLPIIILAALRKIRQHEAQRAGRDGEGEGDG